MGDTTMTLRRGTVEDARQVADHNIAMALETESLALDDATCLAGCKSILGDSSKGFYTVAVEDGRVVGQLMITYEWSDWRNRMTWWIQSVYVVPDRRGRGIFKALYSHVRALCEEEGGAGLRLYADNSNVKAQAVYGKLGMVRVSPKGSRSFLVIPLSLSRFAFPLSDFALPRLRRHVTILIERNTVHPTGSPHHAAPVHNPERCVHPRAHPAPHPPRLHGMSDPSFAVGVEVAVDEQLVGVSTSGQAHVHRSVGEDVFVEKEADPFFPGLIFSYSSCLA